MLILYLFIYKVIEIPLMISTQSSVHNEAPFERVVYGFVGKWGVVDCIPR